MNTNFPLASIVILVFVVGHTACRLPAQERSPVSSPSSLPSTSSRAGSAPALPSGELGRVIRLGREVIEQTNTHPLSQRYVGNALTCTSCHLDAGTHPKAATFLGVATAYPAWSPREKRVITLEDRILNCFMRSMNGTRPPNGSEVSLAMTAYITWLSSGEALRMNAEKPLGPRHLSPLSLKAEFADVKRGRALYENQCADCHGEQGDGTLEGPPVWGPNSFNQGAGLSRTDKLGAWLKVAMPLDDPVLSDQEALDIAAFINSHSRPPFELMDHLPAPEQLGEYNADPSTLSRSDAESQ